jgi:hypothetical protein
VDPAGTVTCVRGTGTEGAGVVVVVVVGGVVVVTGSGWVTGTAVGRGAFVVAEVETDHQALATLRTARAANAIQELLRPGSTAVNARRARRRDLGQLPPDNMAVIWPRSK